ncbi:glycosyltransferase [Microcoleus sp. herbarium7]|uniref:glycosyltransferase n=1 Tax=Microcoleus sp. herbarium7 TaxID=3055435 RepID=UPI002FCF2751
MITEKPQPKVTIVIPVYNREKYLGIAVESVLRQTYTDWELIISDDGSTDATLDLANNFALHDDRICVLTAEHKGAVHALIAGFDAATGEFIGQLDSDDLLEPEAIELTIKALDEHPDWGMVYTNYRDIDKQGQLVRVGWRCSIPYSSHTLLTKFMTFHFRLIRKSIYQEVGGFDASFDRIEDYELCLRLSEMTKIGKIDEFLYQYRFHADSLKSTARLEVILLAKKVIELALKRRGLNENFEVQIEYNPQFSLISKTS